MLPFMQQGISLNFGLLAMRTKGVTTVSSIDAAMTLAYLASVAI